MTPESVISIGQEAVYLVLQLIAILLLPSLAVGLIVSVFQAATQINEQTLSFIPKLVVAFVVLLTAGPWIMGQLIGYTTRLFQGIPGMIG